MIGMSMCRWCSHISQVPFLSNGFSFERLIHLELLRRLQLLQLPNCEASHARAHAKWLSMPMRDTRHHEAQQLGTLYTERHHLADLAVSICSEWLEQNASLKESLLSPAFQVEKSHIRGARKRHRSWQILEVYTTVLTWNEWTRCQNLVSLSNPKAYIPTSNCPNWAWTKCFRINTANETFSWLFREAEWGHATKSEEGIQCLPPRLEESKKQSCCVWISLELHSSTMAALRLELGTMESRRHWTMDKRVVKFLPRRKAFHEALSFMICPPAPCFYKCMLFLLGCFQKIRIILWS